MTTGEITDVFYMMFSLAIKTAGPILVIAMIVGIVISILQAATQVNEQTLTFVPKLVVIGVMLVLFGSTMLASLQDFLLHIFDLIRAG